MEVVFTKTPKGREEIGKRTGELTPRMRRILILVDGKRSVEELYGFLDAADLAYNLCLLESHGHIEVVGVNDQTGEGIAVAVAQASPLRQEHKEVDRVRLAQEAAYRFMSAIADNEPGYEAACCALFARDLSRLRDLTERWPRDIRARVLSLVEAIPGESDESEQALDPSSRALDRARC